MKLWIDNEKRPDVAWRFDLDPDGWTIARSAHGFPLGVVQITADEYDAAVALSLGPAT